jgi:hypothetical protein
MAQNKQSNKQSNETNEMNGMAVGLEKDPTTGLWNAVVLKFNGTSGEASISRVVSAGNNKLEAAEKFKVLAVEEGMVI